MCKKNDATDRKRRVTSRTMPARSSPCYLQRNVVSCSPIFLRNTDTPLNSLRPVALGDTTQGAERIVAGGFHVLIEARTDDYQRRVLYSFGRGDRVHSDMTRNIARHRVCGGEQSV